MQSPTHGGIYCWIFNLEFNKGPSSPPTGLLQFRNGISSFLLSQEICWNKYIQHTPFPVERFYTMPWLMISLSRLPASVQIYRMTMKRTISLYFWPLLIDLSNVFLGRSALPVCVFRFTPISALCKRSLWETQVISAGDDTVPKSSGAMNYSSVGFGKNCPRSVSRRGPAEIRQESAPFGFVRRHFRDLCKSDARIYRLLSDTEISGEKIVLLE